MAAGRLHGHFGDSREFAFLEIDARSQTVLNTKCVPAPPHQPGLFPSWLREQDVTAVIVGGIGQRALEIFAQNGITVRAGWPGVRVEVLAAAYLAGKLPDPPEACEHHDHHHYDLEPNHGPLSQPNTTE